MFCLLVLWECKLDLKTYWLYCTTKIMMCITFLSLGGAPFDFSLVEFIFTVLLLCFVGRTIPVEYSKSWRNELFHLNPQNTSKETENKLNFINHAVLQIRALQKQKSHFSMSQLFKPEILLVLAWAMLETLNMIQTRNTFSFRKYIY